MGRHWQLPVLRFGTYRDHSASPSAVCISGTAVTRGFVGWPENVFEFGRYFVLYKFPFLAS